MTDEKQPSLPGKYKVFVYHHTHWDREWWATLQDFRIRLVELIDELLDTLDRDPEFRCFWLDGQTIVLKDYLEIRPENKERLLSHIRANRIQCGPWYILPDEFLVSGEAHIRNFMLGARTAEQLGVENQAVGYIPDTFGHISQMPQILRGFGIDNALLWRGTGGPSPDFKQEFLWEAPDGSQVLTYWFPDGYYVVDFLHFDNPKKTYAETYGRVRRSLHRWSARATTDNLLMPYGGDHRLIDARLPRLIRQVNEDLTGEAEMIWATPKDFIDAVRERNPKLDVVRGELREFGPDLPHVLPGVLSSRMYLKRLNDVGQIALERYAEPLSAVAWLHGRKYEASLLWTAWEFLIQNHPHDSICGCSIDPVHAEMLPRFAQSKKIADVLTEKSVQHVNERIDTSDLADDAVALVVHNPLGWSRNDTASVWVPRSLGAHPSTHRLTDAEGQEVPFQAKDVEGVRPMTDQFFYTEVAFPVVSVPGLGYRTYYLQKRENPLDPKQLYFTALQPVAKGKGSEAPTDLRVGKGSLENDLIRVEVNPKDGTLNVTDKSVGVIYEGLGAFESGGDAGDTYNFSAPLMDQVLRTTETLVRVHVSVADTGYAKATLKVDIAWQLPGSLSSDRHSRAGEYTPYLLTQYVTLAAGSDRVDVRTVWHNRAEDHRLRALFPLGEPVKTVFSEGHFDVLERTKVADPGDGWPEPYVPQQPLQGFVSMNAGGKGLTIAGRGLTEFEMLNDASGTLGITLLRAVGWLSRNDLLSREGGAGAPIPVPDAQSLGANEAEYSIIVHSGGWLESGAYRKAHEYRSPSYGSVTGKHAGTLERTSGWMTMEGESSLLLSACKKSEHTDSLILRFWNVDKKPSQAVIRFKEKPARIRYVNLKELPEPETQPIAAGPDDGFTIMAGGAEIITIEVAF